MYVVECSCFHIELWLEPKDHKYGPDYNSGRIVLAMARGNDDLKLNSEDLSSKRLEYGVVMGAGNKVVSKNATKVEQSGWYSGFHNFTLVWTHGVYKTNIEKYYKM